MPIYIKSEESSIYLRKVKYVKNVFCLIENWKIFNTLWKSENVTMKIRENLRIRCEYFLNLITLNNNEFYPNHVSVIGMFRGNMTKYRRMSLQNTRFVDLLSQKILYLYFKLTRFSYFLNQNYKNWKFYEMIKKLFLIFSIFPKGS